MVPSKMSTDADEGTEHGNPKSRMHRAVVTAFFYGFMSVATVFLNKAIFKVHHFKYPATLVVGQMAFTLVLVFSMQQCGLIRKFQFNVVHFRKVGGLSFFFVLKLLLDMSALSVVNIPMYGVLKSSTTPCVLLLDYVLRKKMASRRVQLAVAIITTGGFIAGCGDLTFDGTGYILAIGSALSTAAYVVMVGKLGEDMKMDSWMLLFYNCLWSLPGTALLMILMGEAGKIHNFPGLHSWSFVACFSASCGSAFVLNWATYMCTLENDSLTTSVVGRTKSIVQTMAGLFAFGDVQISALNLLGVGINTLGIMWYSVEKYFEHRHREVRVKANMELDRVEQGSKVFKVSISGDAKMYSGDLKSPRASSHMASVNTSHMASVNRIK